MSVELVELPDSGTVAEAGRVCTTCRQSLPISAYGRHAKYPDGLSRQCRACCSLRMRRLVARRAAAKLRPVVVSASSEDVATAVQLFLRDACGSSPHKFAALLLQCFRDAASPADRLAVLQAVLACAAAASAAPASLAPSTVAEFVECARLLPLADREAIAKALLR